MGAEKGPFRILFVDDDLLVLEVWQAILASSGYEVKATNDPRKAVEFVQREDFDLVITDLGMPKMDGWAVAKAVKEMNAMTPVLVLSGWGVQYEKRDLSEYGVNLIIQKPVDRRELTEAIEELVTHSLERPGRRRRHKRVRGERGGRVRVARLSPGSPSCLGVLFDISMSGLSFMHNESENPVGALLRVEVQSPEDFILRLPSALVVYDVMQEYESNSGEKKTYRRCGVQFEDLSEESALQLTSFIQSRAGDKLR